MRGETYLASLGTFGDAVELWNYGSSSKTMLWGDSPTQLTVTGLYGCTSIIVVSTRGVWASHFWEDPSFVPRHNIWEGLGSAEQRPNMQQQLDLFLRYVLHPLLSGVNDPRFHECGLGQLRLNSCKDKYKGIFDDDADIRVYMFAPLDRVTDPDNPNYLNPNPTGLAYMFDAHNDDPYRMDRDGKPYNEQIMDNLFAIFQSALSTMQATIEKVPYAPLLGNGQSDPDFSSPRGKVLVQYQPGSGCDRAKWRVWFEGNDVAGREWEWNPLPGQVFSLGPVVVSSSLAGSGVTSTLPVEKRQASSGTTSAAACPLSAPSSAFTTTTSSAAATTTADLQPMQMPLTVGTVRCTPESQLPGHGAVAPGPQAEFAVQFCGDLGADHPVNLIKPGDPPVRMEGHDLQGVTYSYNVTWKSGCATSVQAQDLWLPVGAGGPNCTGIQENNYKLCNNGGVGGKTLAGCLEYQFTGGL